MKNKVTKSLLFFVFLFFSLFPVSAVSSREKKIEQTLTFSLSNTTSRGIERYKTQYALQYDFISYWFDATAGIQAYEDIFDFTIAAEYWLPFTNWYFHKSRLSLGLGGLYHYQNYFDISCEHDYLADACIRYKTDAGFTFLFRNGWSGKATKIYAINTIPYIYDNYYEAVLFLDKIWQCGFEMYLEFGTHEFYRYPVFSNPHYMLGAAYNMTSGLRLGGDLTVGLVDHFTTPPYLSTLLFRLTMRMKF